MEIRNNNAKANVTPTQIKTNRKVNFLYIIFHYTFIWDFWDIEHLQTKHVSHSTHEVDLKSNY